MPQKESEISSRNSIIISTDASTYHYNRMDTTSPLATIVQVLALAEIAISKTEFIYWSVSQNLDKHRETREYDAHIQKILLFLECIGGFRAEEVPCGKNGFYRTLLQNQETSESIFLVHTWDPNAQYIKEYTLKNLDQDNPKFALIQYNLDEARTKVSTLNFIIPSANGIPRESFDLMPLIESTRRTISVHTTDINRAIQTIKSRLLQIEDNTSVIEAEGDVENE